MIVTCVDIKRPEGGDDSRLLAFCSVVLDEAFVVHDVKLIGTHGNLCVAMPSRKVMDRCPCGWKNVVMARHCGGCGQRLGDRRARVGEDGRLQLYVDVAHPITPECRARVQEAVISAWQQFKDVPGPAPPSRWGTHRPADVTRQDGSAIPEDVVEFGLALQRYKEVNRRPWPTHGEVLAVLKALGYERVRPPAEAAAF